MSSSSISRSILGLEPAYTRLIDEDSGLGKPAVIVIEIKLKRKYFMIYVGIDVSAKKLSVSFLDSKIEGDSKEFENTTSGFKNIISWIKRKKTKARVCLEATGIYHMDLAIALSNVKCIELMVVNPKASSNFAKALMTRSKTDLVDAEMLAQFAKTMPFLSWKNPKKNALHIRSYARELQMLIRQKAQLKNQKHALESCKETPKAILRVHNKMIHFYE